MPGPSRSIFVATAAPTSLHLATRSAPWAEFLTSLSLVTSAWLRATLLSILLGTASGLVLRISTPLLSLPWRNYRFEAEGGALGTTTTTPMDQVLVTMTADPTYQTRCPHHIDAIRQRSGRGVAPKPTVLPKPAVLNLNDRLIAPNQIPRVAIPTSRTSLAAVRVPTLRKVILPDPIVLPAARLQRLSGVATAATLPLRGSLIRLDGRRSPPDLNETHMGRTRMGATAGIFMNEIARILTNESPKIRILVPRGIRTTGMASIVAMVEGSHGTVRLLLLHTETSLSMGDGDEGPPHHRLHLVTPDANPVTDLATTTTTATRPGEGALKTCVTEAET